MKNHIFNSLKYLFYFSLISLIIIYFFPGSIIGYLFYGNLEKQPELISNPIGTSINHFIFFFYLAVLGFFLRFYEKKVVNSFPFLFIVSFMLEFSHYLIPNRAFEMNDMYANSLGVVSAFFLSNLFKKFKNNL